MNEYEASHISVTVREIDILEIIQVIISAISAIFGTILFLISRINKNPHLLKKAFRFLQLSVIGAVVIIAIVWLFVLPQASTINIFRYSNSTKKILYSNRLVNYVQRFCIILIEFLSVVQWLIFVLVVWLLSKIYLFAQEITQVFSLLTHGFVYLFGVLLAPRKHS